MKNIARIFSVKEIIVIVLFIVIVIASPVILFVQASNGDQETLENQGYLRYMACVVDVRNSAGTVSIPAAKLDQCWTVAEQQVGIKLPRYYNLVK